MSRDLPTDHERAALLVSDASLSHCHQATLLDALEAHIAVLDATGTIIAVNAPWRRFAAANGYPGPGAGYGLNYLVVCDAAARAGDDDAVAVGAGLRDLLAGRPDAYTRDYPCHSPGAKHWFTLRAACASGDGPPRLVVAHEEITARRTAEMALRQSAESFADLFEATAEATAISVDGRIVAINPAYTALTGYTPAEVLGRAPADLAAPAEAATVAAQLRAGHDRPYEVLHRHRDGTLVAVEIFGHAIRYQGRPARLTTLRDIAARKANEARLAHQATHDALTGLPNRALFLDRLVQALARTRRDAAATCAVFFLDLDRFKQVNDTLGHAAGDELLVALTTRLRDCLRSGDTLARFGGDEFALLLEEVGDLTDVRSVAERLLAALRDPLPVAGRALTVTLSVGIALRASPADTPAELLRRADVALYRAKAAGRATYAVFDPGLDTASTTVHMDGL